MSHRPLRVAIVIAAIVLVAALAPPPSRAAVTGCEDGSRQQRLTGSYVAAGEPYARAFVFAMQIDCKGKKEVVTVQRATGNLPVCEPGQQVELTGTLVWNRYLVDGHYEVNDPSGVTCRTVAATAPAVPSPPPAAAATAPPAVAAT
ncbi:MAG TPA: hypothetical protein VFL90_13135, partial [Methylomirabilota bacterium]|nr:hypothetical protein [Methylomirabilota bacterium]